jgi:hypothetical protein
MLQASLVTACAAGQLQILSFTIEPTLQFVAYTSSGRGISCTLQLCCQLVSWTAGGVSRALEVRS